MNCMRCTLRTMSSLIFWTRVGNLSLFRSSMNGGFQLGGGTMQQMPNRSSVSRIDRMYSIGFSNSAALGWNMGASRSSGLASSLLRALFDGIVAIVRQWRAAAAVGGDGGGG